MGSSRDRLSRRNCRETESMYTRRILHRFFSGRLLAARVPFTAGSSQHLAHSVAQIAHACVYYVEIYTTLLRLTARWVQQNLQEHPPTPRGMIHQLKCRRSAVRAIAK